MKKTTISAQEIDQRHMTIWEVFMLEKLLNSEQGQWLSEAFSSRTASISFGPVAVGILPGWDRP